MTALRLPMTPEARLHVVQALLENGLIRPCTARAVLDCVDCVHQCWKCSTKLGKFLHWLGAVE